MEKRASEKKKYYNDDVKPQKIQDDKKQQKEDTNKKKDERPAKIKDKKTADQAKSLSKEEITHKKCLCKIQTKSGFDIGFLCHIPNPVLITNNHILNQEDIQPGKKIKISFNDEMDFKTIFIDEKRKTYTIEKDDDGNEIDVTIIEIRPKEDGLQDQEFLEHDEYLLKNDFENEYNKKNIYVIHYKNGECISSTGIINKLSKRNNTYDIEYTVDTEFESCGSPLILMNNKVIGIQREFLTDKNCNKGTLLKFPINEYNKKNAIIVSINENENNIIKTEEVDDKKNKENPNIVENEKNEIILKVKTAEEDIDKKINLLSFNEALNFLKNMHLIILLMKN